MDRVGREHECYQPCLDLSMMQPRTSLIKCPRCSRATFGVLSIPDQALALTALLCCADDAVTTPFPSYESCVRSPFDMARCVSPIHSCWSSVLVTEVEELQPLC